MELVINGKQEKIVGYENISVSELLKIKKVEMPDMVSVELNGEFLERDKFSETLVKSGDTIEFLYFMGGGR